MEKKSKNVRTDSESSSEKKKYPTESQHYVLYEEIGQGVSAVVRRALCKPFNEIVAIKILDFERENCDLNNVFRETQTMVMVDHRNILKSHCSFVCGHDLWVVMPFMAGGSCLHILKSGYSRGLPEVAIATILRETLRGLEYLHRHGHIHRDVKSGNILIDSHGGIKLGDFGVSACLFDSGDRQRVRNTFVGTPCWMAPEVMEQSGYDFKADIWSFGITALELAHGNAPFSRYPPMKVLLMTLQTTPPGLENRQGDDFTTSFKHMVGTCLLKDPLKRPTAKKLLKHSFFKQARSSDYIFRTLLDGLPALGDRVMELKKKEEASVVRKKVQGDQIEEMSQSEYKRGISSWFFDLDTFRSALDFEEPIEDSVSDNSQPESSNSPPSLEENIYAPAFVESGSDDYQDSEELNDEKAKDLVVQQRGRFKVTSENVDVEKAASTLKMEKTLSAQEIIAPLSQFLRPLSTPNTTELSNNITLFSFLNTVLETNIVQRDIILTIMKHAAAGGFTAERECTSTDTFERNLIEEAHEKEKELLREIIGLKERTLSLLQEEDLQKGSTESEV